MKQNYLPLVAPFVALASATAGITPLQAQENTGESSQVATAQIEDTETDVIQLEDIVITARLKEENLLNSPTAATAIGANALSKPNNDTLADLTNRAPNVLYNDQGGPVSIRGVTSPGISGGVDRKPAIGLFLDGVYLARPLGYPLFSDDLERVEILRGPQSTLYGKNTIGGAINMITPTPDGAGDNEFRLRVGSDGLVGSQLTFETALGERFSNRTTIISEGSDGYLRNTTTNGDAHDIDRQFIRSTFAGQIGDMTDMVLSLDYGRDASDGGLWFSPVAEALDFKTSHDFVPEHERTMGGVSLRLNHEFEAFKLTSITAYRGHEYSHYLDGDLGSTDSLGQAQTEEQRQFSQEFRFSSLGDQTVDWRAGIYYLHEDFDAAQFYDMTSFSRDQWSKGAFDQTAESLAIYANVDWEINPYWELSAGARYSYETKDAVSTITSLSGTGFMGAPGTASGSNSYSNLSPELALSWRPNDQTLAYGKLSTGFKAGGLSTFVESPGVANTYEPEKSWTAELGYKYQLNDQLSFAATAFYTDWKDLQVVRYLTATTRVYENAAAASSKGIELEAAWQVNDELRLSGYYGYTDGKYDSYVDSIAGTDFSGNNLPYTPESSFGLSLDWERPISSTVDLNIALDYSYRSEFAFNPDNAYLQDDVHLVDLSVAFKGERVTTRLFAKNLTDERYLKNYFSFSGTDVGTAAAGRQLGIEAVLTF
ncbi:TonB-dependent receptor [Pseudophaeobacter sp.]|uniref:TonB-dependent receptor n=1 Tax=Pseudophaeobacter sp. TaxID=1971739 RepID=UPI004059EE72